MPANLIRCGLAGLLLIYASAGIVFDTWYRNDLEVESLLCRFSLCANDLLLEDAHRRLYSSDPEEARQSVASFQEALRRNSASPYRWCDLGEALLSNGDIERSRYCFRQAFRLGPHSPPVLLRAATFSYRTGDEKRALRLMSRVLHLTRKYDPVIFGYYARMESSVGTILQEGIPEDAEAGRSFVRDLIRRGSPGDLPYAWSWLSSRSMADDELLRDYLDRLIRAEQYAIAADDFKDYVGNRGEAALETGKVFNAGFESELLGVPLSWALLPGNPVEVSRDPAVFHQGLWSLKLRFTGEENVAFHHVRQRIVVEPGVFRFKAFARSDGITTDQGVGFHIFDAEQPRRLSIRTEQALGTSSWKAIEASFQVPPETRLLEIRMARLQSWKIDSKIAGAVWVDDVSLVRRAASAPRRAVVARLQ